MSTLLLFFLQEQITNLLKLYCHMYLIQSHNKSIMEKVNMIESLAVEEKATIYKMLDAFLSKKKLKDALASVLKDVE